MTGKPDATVWRDDAKAADFLEGTRGAIPFAAEQLDLTARIVRGAAIPVGRILDIGCGDGVLARSLLAHWPGANAVYTDFSPFMLSRARGRHPGGSPAGVYLEVDYSRPEWEEPLLGHGPFDVVLSGYSIHHQPDPVKKDIYRAIHRLLAPGGIFLHHEHVASPAPWMSGLFDTFFLDSLEAWHRARGSEKSRVELDREYYNRPDKEANILAPLDEQLRWLRDIGFRDVEVFFKVFELSLFGGRR